jgi:hypothetical protein
MFTKLCKKLVKICDSMSHCGGGGGHCSTKK